MSSSSKRKIEAQDYDLSEFYDKTATRVLNFEVINRNVKSNSGKIKSQTLIAKTEEVFKETLPLRYEVNETPQYLIIGIHIAVALADKRLFCTINTIVEISQRFSERSANLSQLNLGNTGKESSL